MTLFQQFRPIIIPGVLIALWRVVKEFMDADKALAAELTMSVSSYYVCAALWVGLGLTRWFDGISTRRMFRGVLLVTLCVAVIPNAIGYTSGQFQGWNFGRYAHDGVWHAAEAEVLEQTPSLSGDELRERVEAKVGRPKGPDRSFPIVEGAGMKVLLGIGGGLGTGIAAFIWNAAFMALGVLLPRRSRGKKPPVAG